MSKAQNLEIFKQISTFKVSPTARYVASMVVAGNTLNIATLIELTGLPRSTIYRALSDVNDAVPEGYGILIEYSRLTDETDSKKICLTDETETKNSDPVPCTDEPAPHIEERARLIEEPTVLSLSQPQQQPDADPVHAGLLSLLKAEWNLYTDTEARTALLSEFRIYGEKNVLDAYSSFIAEKRSKRAIIKPWKFIQATARGMRDAPPPNVVTFQPKASVLANLSPMPTNVRPALEEV